MAIYSLGRRRIIALLVLSSVLLITLDLRGNAVIDRLRSGMSLALSPFDAAARTISRPIVNAWHGITGYDDLLRENEALREEIAVQRGAEIEYRAGILEYQELLTLNRLTSLSSYPTVTARVQGDAPSNVQNTVEIDRGSNDGVAVGMPVVNGAGLVGRITKAFPESSVVLLITDPAFKITAKVLVTVDEPTDVTIGPLPPTSLAPGGAAATSTTSTTTTTTTTTTTSTTVPGAAGAPGDPTEPGTTATAPSSTTTTPQRVVVRETGVLAGRGNDEPLVLSLVEGSSSFGPIEEGSTVQTAGGTGSLAPAGLPIGTISAVREQTGTRTPLVEVEPVAGDLSRLNFLTVLLYQPAAGGG